MRYEFPFQVLFVDDRWDAATKSICRQIETSNGATVDHVTTVEQAKAWLASDGHRPCVVVFDYDLGTQWKGDEATQAIRDEFPGVEVVLLAGFPEKLPKPGPQLAMDVGARGYATKAEEGNYGLLAQIRMAFEHLTLRMLDQVIHGNVDAGTRWQAILDAALALTGAEFGQVLEHDPSLGELLVRANRSGGIDWTDLSLPVGEDVFDDNRSINRLVARDGHYRHIPDLSKLEDGELKRNYRPLDDRMRSALTVPLRRWGHPEEVFGVINIESSEANRFSYGTIKLLTQEMADRVAVALRKHHEQDRLKLLYEAATSATRSIELEEVLREILKGACDLTRADCGGIFLKVPGEDTLVLEHRWPENVSGDELVQVGQKFPYHPDYEGIENDGRAGIVARAARTLMTQRVPDVSKDRDYVPCLVWVRSELVVCILGDDKALLGALNLENRFVNGFWPDDVGYLELLATHVASAISNAQRYKELQKAQETIDLYLKVMGYSAASAVVAHNLSSALSSIERYAAVLGTHVAAAEQGRGLPVEKMQGTIADMRRAIREAIELAPRDVALVDPGQTELLPINDFVQGLASRTGQSWFHKLPKLTVNFHTELLPSAAIRASRYWLDQALVNVVQNAINAFARGQTEAPQLDFRLIGQNDRVMIQIQDNGPGIPPVVLDQLGRARISEVQGASGGGLGFMLARYVVSAYGGDIQVAPSHPDGHHGALVTASFRLEPERTVAGRGASTKTGGENTVKDLAIVISPAQEWTQRLASLSCENVEVVVEHGLATGLELIAEATRVGRRVTLVFVSLDMPEGGQAVSRVREICGDARVVATGQSPDWRAIRLAFREGANNFGFESVESDALAKLAEQHFGGTCVLADAHV